VEADLVLGALLVIGILLGVFRGAVRQLIIVGAWIVVFIASIYFRQVVGDFIVGNLPEYTREYIDMLAFLSTFVIVFTLVVIIVELRGATVHLSKRPAVDEILGALLGLGWMLLAIASVIIALDSFYLLDSSAGADEIPIIQEIHLAFERSAIVTALRDSLIPGLIAILGFLLPGEIRALYA
jgi:uncharacterized membrane protein required for colicin V production